MGDLDERNRGAGAYSTPGVDTRLPEKPFVPLSVSPTVKFRLDSVDPPSALYIRQEDNIALFAFSNRPGSNNVIIRGRLLRASDGKVIAFQTVFPVTNNRAANSTSFKLVEGYLLSIDCAFSVSVQRGQVFVAVEVQTDDPSGIIVQHLISDYISTVHNPTWPGGEFVGAAEGPGFPLSNQVGNPAAGADWSLTVPTGARWRIQSLVATLVTAVAVANRIPTLVIDDGVNILFQTEPAAAQAASLTKVYALGAGTSPLVGAGQTVVSGVPSPQFLLPGYRIRTVTTGIQGADQWSGISVQVEEWLGS